MASTVYLTTTVSPIIGRSRVAVRLPVPKATVAISPIIGQVRPVVRGAPEIRVAVSAIIGRTRIKGFANTDQWTTAGYPLPLVSGYGFGRDSGVKRTLMRSGKTRQRRQWLNGLGKADVEISLPLTKLNKFEADISRYGYDWFTMPLLTDENVGDTPELHTVRIVGNLKQGNLYGNNIRISFPIEYQIGKGTQGLTIPIDGSGARAKANAGTLRTGGTIVQSVFPLNIKAVDAYPGTAISRQFYMQIAPAKVLAGTLKNSTGGQSITQDTKAVAGTLRTGGTLVQGTYREITNGTGPYHLDPLNASAKVTAGLFLGGMLSNYVNVDNIIVSVPDGRNYMGTQDTKAIAGTLRVGGTLIKEQTEGMLAILVDNGGAGTYYTGSSNAKATAGTLRTGSTLTEDQIPGALVINIENEGPGTYYTGAAGARTYSGNFNGGTKLDTDNTLKSIADGGDYFGSGDTKATAGTLRTGGTLLNTDNTISAVADGGNYLGTSDARTWSGNGFNGGMLYGPLNWVMGEDLTWASSAVTRFTGLKISAAPYKSIITAIRVRGGTSNTTISSAFVLIDGYYTQLISSPIVVGTEWVEIKITPLYASAGVVIELAMAATSYTWVDNYYGASSILQGFEAPTQNDAWVYGESAFGIDLLFGPA